MALNWILIIMLLMGIAGGYVAFLLSITDVLPGAGTKREPADKTKPENETNDENENDTPVVPKKSVGQYIVMGIGATILVPLFLQIVQSSLMNDIVLGFTTKNSDKVNYTQQYLLYTAYCFAAAVTSFEFIKRIVQTAVYQKIAKEAVQKAVKAEVKEKKAEAIASNAQQEAEKAQVEVTEKTVKLKRITKQKEAVFKDYARNIEVVQEPFFEKAGPVIAPITHPEDPQKGRFGGEDEVNGRKLTASVVESVYAGYFKVVITVTSIDKDKPLSGNVILYLHDTFFEPVKSIEVKDGKAVWEDDRVWGAFTVGVVADNGDTLLELDLSKLPDAPVLFKSR